jgi:hypothetical protein
MRGDARRGWRACGRKGLAPCRSGPDLWHCAQMFADLVHFTQLTTQTDPADVETINFFVKFTNDWPDVETYSGSNNPGKVWKW